MSFSESLKLNFNFLEFLFLFEPECKRLEERTVESEINIL